MLPLLAGAAARMIAGAAARGAAGAAARGAAGAAVRGGGGALVRGGLGRGLGGAVARGGGRGLMGGLRRAAVRGAGGALTRGAGGLLKGVGSGLFKKKETEVKKVSTEKLLPGSKKDDGGGALIRKKSSAIVKQQTSAIEKVEQAQPQQPSKSVGFDELIQELTAIKETLIKIKSVLGSNLSNTLREQRNQRTLLSKQKASEKEAELEKKPEKKGGKKLEIPKKKMGFLDMIWRYISNVFMGTLLNFLWNYIPQIIKMFEDISKGMSNTWQQLRIGIITLTRLFPKQIKFLAGLTAKIVGPPAKLIGKLLLKAGKVAGNLFKKAGGIVLNLIKGPLLNLIKRVGGEALEQGVKGAARGAARIAGKAAGAAGSALGSSAKLIKRLKVFSGVLKRVPIVGMLIGIGIDLAMGEKLDRAVVGAIGASLGTGIGAAIGQGLIPIPIVGAMVGGTVGAAIGDWAAKKFYGDLTGRVASADRAIPLEKKYAAGRIGGGSRTMPTRTTSIQGKPSIATSKISADVEMKAEEDVLKNEKSLQRFKTLSSVFAGTPFIGQLLKLGIDIGMGATVQKTQTDAAAQDLGFTIGKAMENDEFTVPGLNRRIIGPLSRNLTEWAKKKIFYEVKSREGLFPSIEKGEEETTPTGTTPSPGGPPGPGPSKDDLPGPKSTSANLTPNQRKALDILGKYESQSAGGYNAVNQGGAAGGTIALGYSGDYRKAPFNKKARPLTDLTIEEIMNLQYDDGKMSDAEWKRSGKLHAVGRYQFIGNTLPGVVKRAKVSVKSKFTPEVQDLLGIQYLKEAGIGAWVGPSNYASQSEKEMVQKARKEPINYNVGGGYGFKHHLLPKIAMGGNHQLTSSMGMRNLALSPGMHMGVDIAGTTGEPLQAFSDGTVEATSPPSPSAGYGNWVSWIDDKGIGHFYGHLNKAPSVRAGQKVKKGTVLGELGSTGNSSGPHLHWEAATNPQDTGRPKNAVLSRFNPLSKYNKEAPFGGTIKPDGSSPSSAEVASTSSSATSQINTTSSGQQSQKLDFTSHIIRGAPAVGGGSGTKGKIVEYLTGDPNSPNIAGKAYDRGGHGTPGNYHDHVAFSDRQTAVDAYKFFKSKGVKVTEFKGFDPVGGHASNSYHYSGLAFDIPGFQWGGSGPVGDKDYAGSRKVRALLNEFFGGDIPVGSGPLPADVAKQPGGGGGGAEPAEKQEPKIALDFTSHIIRGAPAIDSVTESIKHKPSYDQGGQQKIVMMPIPQGSSGQQLSRNAGIPRRTPSISGGLNSKEVASYSVRQVLASALYKM